MRIGDQVFVNGQWGHVKAVLNGDLVGMIEVRLPGGVVVVPRHEVTRRFTTAQYQDGFGLWHVRVTDHAEMEPRSSDWAQMIRLSRRRIAAELAVRAPRGTTFDDMLNIVQVAKKETNTPHIYEFVERGAGKNRS